MRSADRVEHKLLGTLLKELRIGKGLSQRQLAEQIDRTHAYVGKVERGYQHIDMATLFDWAATVDADPAEIVRQVHEGASRQPHS